MLRKMNREGLRQVPADAPVDFIRRGWAAYVFAIGGSINTRLIEQHLDEVLRLAA